MARPPKPENARNPLRQLRALLSNKGEIALITQNELSEICDIPINTIRQIEIGRRALNSSARKKIEEVTTATWNPKKARWTVYGSDEPFTFSWYRLHRRFMGKRPPNYQSRIRLIHAKIDGLFDQIPERSWNLLSFRINDSLEECRRDFKLKDLDEARYKAAERFEDFLVFVREQNVKPMYSPTVLATLSTPTVLDSAPLHAMAQTDTLSTASPSTRKRAKRSKAKSALSAR
jgi:transcriptional regulator with XRE-family HTH domain